MMSFEKMLAPFDQSEFFTQYWEQKPLHINRSQTDYYSAILDSSSFDKIIQVGRPSHPHILVTKNQAELFPSKYINPDRSINLNQLYKSFGEGYTVILNSLNEYWLPIREFADNLTTFLNHKVVPNAYFSPAGSIALKPHYDTHDVFVLQCEGSKVWNIYGQPVVAPLVGSFQPIYEKKNLGNPILSVELKSGDLLYVPRGFVHDAETTDNASLHMTVGVYPTQWSDVFGTLLQVASMRNANLRKALPPGFLDNFEDHKPMLKQAFAQLSGEMKRHADFDHLFSVIQSNFIGEAVPAADGHFSQLVNLKSVNSSTRVIIRRNVRCLMIDAPDAVRLQFSGNTIKGSKGYAAAFNYIANEKQSYLVQEIPGDFSMDNKIKLVSRLIRGGLLTTTDP